MAQSDLCNRLTCKRDSRHLPQRLLPVTSEVAGSSPVVPAIQFRSHQFSTIFPSGVFAMHAFHWTFVSVVNGSHFSCV
jgi:hypothetical protein